MILQNICHEKLPECEHRICLQCLKKLAQKPMTCHICRHETTFDNAYDALEKIESDTKYMSLMFEEAQKHSTRVCE
eukprot:TRINITY_DN15901_c0_g1_i1.p1 TRINITY_DN15901_c0_g1~~TRINITY_DN15901_c0_g1_i1.p1  ORF type:complete len:76 (-),score=14.10 TRINITY_DN15901_c0_g1_i1:76-303(-)